MMSRCSRKRGAATQAVGSMVLLMAVQWGCFSEHSFELSPQDTVRLREPGVRETASTRVWLASAHAELAPLLPPTSSPPLLTEDMVSAPGEPIDVFAHFDMRRRSLRSVLGNFRGIRCTAQAASREPYIDQVPPSWPDFEDIWIPIELPIDDELELSARIGFARDAEGRIVEADCLIILPGLFGDNGVKRTRDLAIPLREAGFHVLALEIRGHGQTERRFPHMFHTFGVLETDELLQVSDWLESRPHVRRTGLIGFCWSANIALLTAWFDNHAPDDPMISPAIRPYLVARPTGGRRYAAGIIAFSPVLRWECLLDDLDKEHSTLGDPVYAAIQDTVRHRMEHKGYPEKSGNLRRLIDLEYRGYNVPMPRGSLEGYPFLRLLPYRDKPAGDKMEYVRTPTLIFHGADDPLAPSQDVADLVARVENPAVAALILPSGGHVGFAAYAKDYYFSMILNFFDPLTGAAAAAPDVAATGESPSVTSHVAAP